MRTFSWLERCYRLWLHAYPRAFRERFGREMRELARGRVERATAAGFGAKLREAGALLSDVVRTAPAEWSLELHARRKGRRTPIHLPTQPRQNMDVIVQDVRLALRGLLRRPGFTLVATLTLALGIGANTAIFSVVDAVLLRPIPYPNGDRMVEIWGVQGTQGRNGIVYPDYLEWRAQNHTFADMGVFRSQSVNLTGGDEPDRLVGVFASASFMRLIGAAPVLGRAFTEAETEIAGKAPIAVLSYESWQTRFGGDSAIVGKMLVLNGQPHTVVGVTKPHVQTPFGAADVYLPLPYYPNASGLERGTRALGAIGTLKPGATIAAAERDLTTLARRQEEMYPGTNKGFGVELQSLRDELVGSARASIYIVFGAGLVVLLIACANVANLQLARGATRHREISVRAALGGGRGRIAQQLFTESMMLSLAGGAAGLALAVAGTKYLATVLASSLPLGSNVEVDGPALLFALAASVLSGLLFGVAPAWKASRANVGDVLRARGGAAGHGHAKTRNTLVVVQLALSLALLSCAGVLTRSLIELQRVHPGFDANNLMTAQFRLPAVKYDSPEKINAMFDRAIAEIRAVPGVESAALVRAFPFSGNGETSPMIVEGRPPVAAGDAPTIQINSVTPRYFTTMRIPQLAGRDLSEADNMSSAAVIVVNDLLAKSTWPNESALGKRLQFPGDDRWWTVIGVVGGAKQFALNEQQAPQAYISHAQRPQIFTALAVRTTGNPLRLSKAIREAIWRVDRDQPVWSIHSANELLDSAVGSPRLIVGLTAAFAIVALILGAVGIYGVLSYTISQRTQEMGIRLALGAESRQVVGMVVSEGMRTVGVAIAIGLVASLGATRLLRSQLFGVGPADVLTFSAVTALLGAVAIAACYVPARRASRVDPMVALRAE